MTLFTGSNGWHLMTAEEAEPGIVKITMNSPSSGKSASYVDKGMYGIYVNTLAGQACNVSAYEGKFDTDWVNPSKYQNMSKMYETYMEYLMEPKPESSPPALPYVASNGMVVQSYDEDGDKLSIHVTGGAYGDNIKGFFTPSPQGKAYEDGYHQTLVYTSTKLDSGSQEKTKFHKTSAVGKALAAVEEYVLLEDMNPESSEAPADLFKTGFYIGLPYEGKHYGSTIVVDELRIDENGVMLVKAWRKSIYGDKKNEWEFLYKNNEDKSVIGVQISGVLWTNHPDSEWGKFDDGSNAHKVWLAALAVSEKCEFVVPVITETNEETTTVDYKELAGVTGYTQTFLKQLRCFAAYHQITSKAAAKLLKVEGGKLPNSDSPQVDEFKGAAWADLREKAVAAGHVMAEKSGDVCLTCANEADKNKGVIPPKLKQFIAFSHDEGKIGTKADTDEAKIIRNQISAFAHYHSWNRYEAVEKIKSVGENADLIMPYIFPAEKTAAKPDYYKLKTHDWPDLGVILSASGKWKCHCDYCDNAKMKYQKWYSKGLKHQNITLAEVKALLPEPVDETKKLKDALGMMGTQQDNIAKGNPVKSAGSKDVECLLTSEEFNQQLGAFAGAHGINRYSAYQCLPNSWKMLHKRYYAAEAAPVPYSGYLNAEEGIYNHYGQVAVATQCKCNTCKFTIKNTPKKVKMALTKKKKTKKAALEVDTAIEQAMGAGLTENFSLTNMPLDKQVLAYAAYHELVPYDVWKDKGCYGGQQNPFDDFGDVPEVGELEFHIWPDLGKCGPKNGPTCSECSGQPVPPEEEKSVPTIVAEAKTWLEEVTKKNEQGIMTLTANAITYSTMDAAVTMKVKKVFLSKGEQVVVSAPEGGNITVPDDAVYTVIPGTAVKMSS